MNLISSIRSVSVFLLLTGICKFLQALCRLGQLYRFLLVFRLEFFSSILLIFVFDPGCIDRNSLICLPKLFAYALTASGISFLTLILTSCLTRLCPDILLSGKRSNCFFLFGDSILTPQKQSERDWSKMAGQRDVSGFEKVSG